MQLIKQQKFNKKIKNEFDYEFKIKEKGLYAIEITASCKSWQQNLIQFISFLQDDDLAVKIDDISFLKLDSRRGLFDGEAAWNGNNLKGLTKTNFFLINLDKRKHAIHFLIDQEPYLENIKIYSLKDSSFEIKNRSPQDGNRRQWMTFVLVNLSLKRISITATASKLPKEDDDDLKLIIDNRIQKNTELKSHKYWYWCGNSLKGKKKEYTKDLNLPQELHYIELWADRMPVVEEMKLNLDELDLKSKAKVVWKHTVLREEPNQKSNILIDKINKNSKVLILEKAIKGERPINEENNEPYSSDRWHKVEYQNTVGYIFSMALEIEGEDKETIKNLIVQKSKELNENECLMFAIAKRESGFFPYSVSSANAQGIFQLKDVAVEHVNKEFGKNFFDQFDLNQNIESGILYFQIIKIKYEGKDDFWEKCLAAWNRGMGYVSADEAFIMNDQPTETQQFIQDVFSFWEDCKNKFKNKGRISLSLLLSVGILALVVLALFFLKKPYPIPSDYKDFSVLVENKIDIDEDRKDEKIVTISNISTEFTFGITKILLIEKDGSFLELPDDGGEFQWIKVDDFNKNEKIDVAVLYGYSGSAGFGDFYLYEWRNSNFITLISREEISAEAEFKDLDNDGIKEILFSFHPLKWSREQIDTYRWDEKSLSYIKS